LLFAVFTTAVGLHTAWDSASTTPAYVIIAAISLSLLAITSHWLRRSQSSAAHQSHSHDLTSSDANRDGLLRINDQTVPVRTPRITDPVQRTVRFCVQPNVRLSLSAYESG